MSRSGYSDWSDYDDPLELGRYRRAVQLATNGKRGQKMLRELLAALDAMPVKELITEELQTKEGQFCALGALGNKRGLDMEKLDPNEADDVADAFKVAPSLVREIVYENDERSAFRETPAQRWARMRAWVVANIRAEQEPQS
jgi:hypothetical protein